ncbi:MAG: prepilin peptidase dependent protein A, partial [Butyrivibrio sp.]|nr:prepilin peptidase dependent protein A [Butyrivibrio sp.]
VKEKVEDILNGFSGELMDTYISINASMQGMNKQEQYILKAAMGIEAFLQKATGGSTSLKDITVENGRIKGLKAPLDKLLNAPGQNQTYLDYRADILAIKNYERLQGNSLLGGFRARYAIDGKTIK